MSKLVKGYIIRNKVAMENRVALFNVFSWVPADDFKNPRCTFFAFEFETFELS